MYACIRVCVYSEEYTLRIDTREGSQVLMDLYCFSHSFKGNISVWSPGLSELEILLSQPF